VYNLATEVGPKRLELLRQLVPSATEFAVLLHPDNPGPHIRNLQAAAQTLGVRLHLLPGKSEHEFGAAFAAMAKLRAGGLVITADLFFAAKSRELAALATKHAIPAAFHFRDFVEAGGLMSYGTDLADSYHVIGTYAGRILKGATPGDLPVQQSTKVQLIINLKTAKALGLTVPLPLLGRADEVIE
jgi:putative ABC transport system substrate-binding protein